MAGYDQFNDVLARMEWARDVRKARKSRNPGAQPVHGRIIRDWREPALERGSGQCSSSSISVMASLAAAPGSLPSSASLIISRTSFCESAAHSLMYRIAMEGRQALLFRLLLGYGGVDMSALLLGHT